GLSHRRGWLAGYRQSRRLPAQSMGVDPVCPQSDGGARNRLFCGGGRRRLLRLARNPSVTNAIIFTRRNYHGADRLHSCRVPDRRGRLESSRWLIWILMLAFPFPYIANTLGWMTAELGRQPWLIYGLFHTSEGYSKVVSSGDTVFTMIGFVGLYFVLGVLFLA